MCSDSTGFQCDFSDIPGLEESLWTLYCSYAQIAQSNDSEGRILSSRALFGIPPASYEILGS